jgi:hypothetical protein
MDKHLKKFFKVKDCDEEKWDIIIEKISNAEKIENKNDGVQEFINIMKKIKPFGKMRKFAIKSLRKYTERK